MRPPRYWHRHWVDLTPLEGDSSAWRIPHWGWSSNSQEEAVELALARTKRSVISWSVMTRDANSAIDEDWYDVMDYLVTPPREEVLHEVLAQDGSASHWVSRNRYGAEILNTRNLAIIDVDRPASFDRFQADTLAEANSEMEQLLISACEALERYGFRIYRTFAGWRLIITSHVFDGVTDESIMVMTKFPTDDLYRKLCVRHKCYRARLSPKPWRIGCERFNTTYPYDRADLPRITQWIRGYYTASKGFRTAELIYDDGQTASDLEPIIALHDSACCINLELPLA